MNISRRAALAAGAGLAAWATQPHLADAQAPASPTADAAQAPGFYRYKIGDIEVTAINDGFVDRGLEGYVKNVGLAEVETEISKLHHAKGKIRVPYNSLVLRTGGKTVMIDAGNGDSGAPTTGRWMANFKAAGFDPKNVDIVLLTHLHGDHINGLRLKSGQAMFENAEIKLPQAEWAYWMDDGKMAASSDAMKGQFANIRRVFGPIAGKITQVKADESPAPGVTAIAAYGHSPGHTAYAIASGNQRLIMMADTAHHTSVFLKNPNWHVLFDMDPELAAKTRRRMAELAISESAQVAFYHAPFPATGFIEKAGDAYRLEPVQWS